MKRMHGYRFRLPGASAETGIIQAWPATEARRILRQGMPAVGHIPKGTKMREVSLKGSS